ncbi:hypothetical protein [Stutzerimonas xanthomarina]|uniref:hypothetical protein n=1 Tax=Stutzerimonas xanthomarina TaxID=271420 RepID=UPI003AA81F17
MLLIGIAAANPLAREQVAKAMEAAGVCSVSCYSDTPAKANNSPREMLRRLDRLNEMIKATPAKGAECLVAVHLVHEVEASRIRSLGGYVVHVEGVPSDEVPIVRGDLLVTATDGGHRHFIDGQSALSELWVSKGAA